jgi:hypothetical protein
VGGKEEGWEEMALIAFHRERKTAKPLILPVQRDLHCLFVVAAGILGA